MLQRVVRERGARRGRALDLGCGAGAYSIYLAQQGYQVTGVDYLAEPIRMAQESAQAQGASVRFIQADALTWESDGMFDLVLDSGCLHTLHPSERPAYRKRLLSWLNHAADYVLIHFGKRHPLDWRPVGPRRRGRAQIVDEFQNDVLLRVYAEEIHAAPLPVGPKVLIGSFWFRRA
jgi:cyclopropane fatty-acyl-phospholipid synthase-like methyltransferase